MIWYLCYYCTCCQWMIEQVLLLGSPKWQELAWLGQWLRLRHTWHLWHHCCYCSCWRPQEVSIECDKQVVTVVSKNMAMSLPDSPPLDFPVNKMTSEIGGCPNFFSQPWAGLTQSPCRIIRPVLDILHSCDQYNAQPYWGTIPFYLFCYLFFISTCSIGILYSLFHNNWA